MERMVYEAPDGSWLFEPSPEQMASIILQADHEYWQRGPRDEAGIRQAQRFRQGPKGVSVQYLTGQPGLWIKQPEPGLFFFTWVGAEEGWVVPYDGSGCDAFVMDERGGDPFKIPRACLVDRRGAVEIVQEFLRSLGRARTVQWRPWSELPLPPDWYPPDWE